MGKGLKREDSAALKGVALLIMVFIHCFRSPELLEKYGVIFHGITTQQVLDFIPYGKICVSIFSFLSGYGLMYGYTANKTAGKTSVRGWTASHVIKVLSGFWFISVLSYFAFAVLRLNNFENWGETPVDRAAAILVDMAGFSELFNTQSLNGTWWYMSAAVIYVMLLPVCADLLERYGGLVCIGLTVAIPRIFGIEYQGGNSVLTFWAAFLTGMLFCYYGLFDRFREWNPLRRNGINHVLKFLLLLILIILGKYTFMNLRRSVYWEYSFALVCVPVIFFCSEYLFKIKLLQKLLAFLGKHSMNIWLVHTFVRNQMKTKIYVLKESVFIFLAILLISLAISFVLEFLKKITSYNRMIKCAVKKAGQIP